MQTSEYMLNLQVSKEMCMSTDAFSLHRIRNKTKETTRACMLAHTRAHTHTHTTFLKLEAGEPETFILHTSLAELETASALLEKLPDTVH